MNDNNFYKYLKYKNKYLKLKGNMIVLNKFNPIIDYKNNKVDLIDDYYVLNEFSSSIHKDKLECNWDYCLRIIKIIKRKNIKNNILCLGFGIGAIPLHLLKLSGISNIDCVDIDSSLFEIYQKLFGNPLTQFVITKWLYQDFKS